MIFVWPGAGGNLRDGGAAQDGQNPKKGIMIGMKAEEAGRFYEEDEDPDEVFATFDAAVKGRTAPAGGEHPAP